MKKILMTIAVVAALMAVSCKKDELPTPQQPTSIRIMKLEVTRLNQMPTQNSDTIQYYYVKFPTSGVSIEFAQADFAKYFYTDTASETYMRVKPGLNDTLKVKVSVSNNTTILLDTVITSGELNMYYQRDQNNNSGFFY